MRAFICNKKNIRRCVILVSFLTAIILIILLAMRMMDAAYNRDRLIGQTWHMHWYPLNDQGQWLPLGRNSRDGRFITLHDTGRFEYTGRNNDIQFNYEGSFHIAGNNLILTDARTGTVIRYRIRFPWHVDGTRPHLTLTNRNGVSRMFRTI